MGDGIGLGEEPAEHAALAIGIQVVGDQVGPEGKDDREANEIDVERQENDAERQRFRLGRILGGD